MICGVHLVRRIWTGLRQDVSVVDIVKGTVDEFQCLGEGMKAGLS